MNIMYLVLDETFSHVKFSIFFSFDLRGNTMYSEV